MARFVLVSLAIALLLGLAVVGCIRRDEHVGIGGEITWDDWGYRVTKVEELDVLADCNLKPSGVFRHVTLEVQNHARRVEYDMSWHHAVLIDAHGEQYQVQAEATRCIQSMPPKTIPAGGSCTTELVFDTPRDAELELSIVWGGRVLQTIDSVFSGERTIALR